jgi:hypothetical protein
VFIVGLISIGISFQAVAQGSDRFFGIRERLFALIAEPWSFVLAIMNCHRKYIDEAATFGKV